MSRLTEYHNGVAVIKNKDFKEAAEKLARIEDGLEQLKWYLDTNEEKGVVYIPKFVIEEVLKGGGSDE